MNYLYKCVTYGTDSVRVIDLYLSYKVKVSKNKVASLKVTGGLPHFETHLNSILPRYKIKNFPT